MYSLQSNTLLSTTKCSNLCSVSLVINKNLDTVLAFKNCRPEHRRGLRNETISKKRGHSYFIKNGQNLPGEWTTTEMTHRVSTLMNCVGFHSCSATTGMHRCGATFLHPLVRLEPDVFGLRTHALQTRNGSWGLSRRLSLNTQIFLNYSSEPPSS